MIPRVAYLDWAIERIGSSPFDLASSGIPNLPLHELHGGAEPPPGIDDPGSWEALQADIARHNAVPADEALATLGTAQAVALAYAALAAPGDAILVESPTYEPLVALTAAAGARVTRFERSAERGFAIDPEAVEAKLTPDTRLVVVSSLHNPTGIRTSDATLRDLAARLLARGVHLLVDEVYAPFDAFVDDRGVFPGSARRLGPNVLAASSLTKCYGLGFQRFGWLLGPADVVARAAGVLRATCTMLPLAHAAYFRRALGSVIPLAERARRLLGGKRARVEAWLRAEHPELRWSAPTSGLFGFAELLDRPGLDLRASIELGAHEHGVLVVPGVFFEMPSGFRLSWSIDEARLDEALGRLSRVLRDRDRRGP